MTQPRRTPKKEQLVFREVQKTAELVDLLRLRHVAYQGSILESFERPNASGFNLDSWDPYSRHYGLFWEAPTGEVPIGYHRLVGARVRPCLRVLDLAHAESSATRLGDRSCPFPMMSYWPESDSLARAYLGRTRSAIRVVEGSRFSIHPDHRSPRTVLALLQAQMANAGWVRNEAVWIMCSGVHARFYERLGFRYIEGTTPQHLSQADGALTGCMEGKRDRLPAAVKQLLAEMAEQMQDTGQIRQQVKLKLRAA